MKTIALVADSCGAALEPRFIELRELGPHDVAISVLYCGVCHTDLHYIADDWKMSHFPLVPGHEVAGRVEKVGSQVTRAQVGKVVGVGYICWSCRECDECTSGRENYCPKIVTTLAGVMPNGEVTRGGFARQMIVREEFVVPIPDGFDPAHAAPLMCAGVTVFSPMIKWNMAARKGAKLGVVGMGGLGHLAVLFGVAMGLEVTVFDIFDDRAEIAKQLGAVKFVNCKDPQQMAAAEESQHFVLDTAASGKPIEPFILLLKTDGILVSIGLPPAEFKMQVPPAAMSFKRRVLVGTLTGSVNDTEQMFDFAAKHHIKPWTEIVSIDEYAPSVERLAHGEVKFRLVLDIANTLTEDRVKNRDVVPIANIGSN